MTYAPSALVVVVRVRLPVVLVKVTLALATAAPDLSLTVPLIYPVSCADTRVAPNKQRTARASIPAMNDLPYTDVRTEKWRDRFPFTLKPPGFLF
jgi:hypothetical protein